MAGTDRSQNITFKDPVVILKEVQLPENVGMVMRTMLNFGFKNLRLVKPKINWNDPKVIKSSAGAYDIIRNKVKVFNTLEESIEDIEFLCATSVRRRDLDSFVDLPANTIENIDNKYKDNSIAFLFGPEKAGLKNQDLSSANIIINIPTVNAFGSLNLAMSVNIICYEWHIKRNSIKRDEHFNKTDLANKKEINKFNNRLIKILTKNNFFQGKENNKKLLTNLKNIFAKNNLTNKELRILHGAISSIKKNKETN